jgi:hypothetical protein
MDQESLVAQFEMLLPLAAAWAAEEEQQILRNGVPLSEKEIGDARAIGVQTRIRFACYGSPPSPDRRNS